MKTYWRFSFACSQKMFGKEEMQTSEVKKAKYAEALNAAEMKFRSKYSYVRLKEATLVFEDLDAPTAYFARFHFSDTFFGDSIHATAEIQTKDKQDAKSMLETFLKKQFKYVTIDSIADEELRRKELSGSCCANCVHCVKEWPYLYCSEITTRRFGEEVMTQVDGDGTCDHFLAKKTTDNSNYRRG